MRVIPPNDDETPLCKHLSGTHFGSWIHLALDARTDAATRMCSDNAKGMAVRIVNTAEETNNLGVSKMCVEVHDKLEIANDSGLNGSITKGN